MAQNKYVRVTQIKYAPLLPSSELLNVDPDRILRRLKANVLRHLKRNLLQTTFSKRAKESLGKSIKIEVKPRSIRVVSNHPAFNYFTQGRRKRQMRWLVKAKRPIPIVTETGALIFRSATPKSMANGRWVHPGSEPSDFLDKAKKQAREVIKKGLKRDLQKQIAERITKGRRR